KHFVTSNFVHLTGEYGPSPQTVVLCHYKYDHLPPFHHCNNKQHTSTMSGPPFWFYGSYYPPQGHPPQGHPPQGYYPPPGQPPYRNEAPFAPPAMPGAGYYPRGHPPPQSHPPHRSDPPFAPPGISRPHQDPIRQQRERPSRHRRRKSELEQIMEAERKQQEQEQAQAQAARVRRWLQDVGEQTSLEEDGVSRPESRKTDPLFAIKKEYH
ncbi:hypothetical protein QBC41DRAFT_398213, partial [Cercophora samala]